MVVDITKMYIFVLRRLHRYDDDRTMVAAMSVANVLPSGRDDVSLSVGIENLANVGTLYPF